MPLVAFGCSDASSDSAGLAFDGLKSLWSVRQGAGNP